MLDHYRVISFYKMQVCFTLPLLAVVTPAILTDSSVSKKEFIIGLCAHEYSNDAVGRWMDVLISASAIPIAVDDLHQNGVLQRDTAIR